MNIDFDISLQDYSYLLPENRIASFGLTTRDQSKLLTYANNTISDRLFNEIDAIIPPHSTLFFNNTKVIQARLQFYKTSGAAIEIFLLNPVQPSEISRALGSTIATTWKCLIGNFKKWKNDEVLELAFNIGDEPIELRAKLASRADRSVEFSFESQSSVSFGQIINSIGNTPLPPYIKRKAVPLDKTRYQTIYSEHEGAVAAPTAGLHFTPGLLQKLTETGIRQEYLTLHVGAGTFRPVQSENVVEHPMHNERIQVSRGNIEAVKEAEFIIPVGTTSMRTLESLYWYGHKLLKNKNAEFNIEKLYPYQHAGSEITLEQSMNALLAYMDSNALSNLTGETEIFIFPGYVFRSSHGLITNFHQPGSTLILLVAAFVGSSWQQIYQHAIKKNYRFLSYGDSSILLP
jgi:S-adenosylmethionine:tRNA ribosyltransferase-isomerase